MKNSSKILAIDPGKNKWGCAVLDNTGGVIERGIFSTNSLYPSIERLVKKHSITCLVLGNGTHSKEFERVLIEIGCEIIFVEEYGSTQEARNLFDHYYPPSGWRRWLPKGFRIPDRDYDDLSAIVIGRRYLEGLPGAE